MRSDLAGLLQQRRGHFELESGHHGDLWLNLELLCSNPSALRPLAKDLAERVRPYEVDAVCGPLVEGAFVALLVAEELGVEFVYAERQSPHSHSSTALFHHSYRVPEAQRRLKDRRLAIVNDVINAGSAVVGTLDDVRSCGAQPVVIAALLSLGSRPMQLAREAAIQLESLETQSNPLWIPAECPLCARGEALTPFPGR